MERDYPAGPEPSNPPVYYVGMGASAGGLEALESFLTHMPPDSGMAFIVVQHLSPDYKSLMVELLSKRTEMPVRRAEEAMTVEANTVYLIPPKKNLTIFHGKLLLSEQDHSKGIKLPIDVFLLSLAEDQADKAIAVILSGTGSDGVRGIRAVKEAGGMVFVQSEDSAKFDGMPRAAISTGLADLVATPEEMPDKLVAFARRPYASMLDRPQTLLSDEDGLTRIFALLRERTKVDFTYYKPSTIVRRIERRMTVNQMEELRDYVKLMERHTGEVLALYRELLIGVTSFFRDREVFDELGEKYLPQLFENMENREIRLWVAGCSTGEEAYTLAILSRECMERQERRLDVKIFATDVDREAILQASNGIYPESIAADLSPKLLAKYFLRKDDRYRIDRSIREMVVFAQHNLVKDPPFTNIDLVSCRNLLIYLQPVLQSKVMDLFSFSLNPNGILLLGTSETTGDMGERFEPLHHKLKIYRTKGKRRAGDGGPEFPMVPDSRKWHNKQRFGTAASILRGHEEERMLERLLQVLAGDYVPLSVVVNSQMEVLHILGNPEGYLRLPTGKLTNDVSKMAAKDLAIPLATGLQRVFRTGEDLKYTNIRLHHHDESRILQMRVKLLPARKGQDPLAVVFLEETASLPRPPLAGEGQVFDISQEAEQRIHDLEQELQFSRENLQATIEELETANEELQATNEELLASNEELQSTNEELQSVNEELHTVNAQYQSKIIELTELNNDLDNLLGSTRIGTLFLDENLEIRKFTPEARQVFRIVEADVGRPLHHLSHVVRNADPLEVVRQVERSGLPQEREILTNDGAWFLMRVMPYRVGGATVSGVVMVFIDIGQIKKVEAELRDYADRMSSLFLASPVGIGLLVDRVLIEVNDRLCEMAGYSRAELTGQTVRMLYDTQEEYDEVGVKLYRQMDQGGAGTIETRWRRRDGATWPVLLSCAPVNPADPHEGVTFTVLDLTASKQAEALALASQEHYRRLFDTMTEGVVYQDEEGAIVSANPAAERMLGLSQAQMQGLGPQDRRWQAVREDGSELPADQTPALRALRLGEPVRDVVLGIISPVGQQRHWVRVNAVPLVGPGESRPSQVYSTLTDITERVKAGQELELTRKRMEVALSVAGLSWWEWDMASGLVRTSLLSQDAAAPRDQEARPTLESWLSRLHPEDHDRVAEGLRQCQEGAMATYDLTYRLRTAAGGYISMRDRGRVVEHDPGGHPSRLIGAVQMLDQG